MAQKSYVHILILLTILVCSVFFRFYNLGRTPGLTADDIFPVVLAQDSLTGQKTNWNPVPYLNLGSELKPRYLPITAGVIYTGPVSIYLRAVIQSFLGTTPYTTKLLPALVGIITVFITFLLGRALFDTEIGLISAAYLGLLPWHVFLSRITLVTTMVTIFFLPISILFFVKGLNRLAPSPSPLPSGDRARVRGYRLIYLASFFMGLAAQGHFYAGLLMFVMMSLIHQHVKENRSVYIANNIEPVGKKFYLLSFFFFLIPLIPIFIAITLQPGNIVKWFTEYQSDKLDITLTQSFLLRIARNIGFLISELWSLSARQIFFDIFTDSIFLIIMNLLFLFGLLCLIKDYLKRNNWQIRLVCYWFLVTLIIVPQIVKYRIHKIYNFYYLSTPTHYLDAAYPLLFFIIAYGLKKIMIKGRLLRCISIALIIATLFSYAYYNLQYPLRYKSLGRYQIENIELITLLNNNKGGEAILTDNLYTLYNVLSVYTENSIFYTDKYEDPRESYRWIEGRRGLVKIFNSKRFGNFYATKKVIEEQGPFYTENDILKKVKYYISYKDPIEKAKYFPGIMVQEDAIKGPPEFPYKRYEKIGSNGGQPIFIYYLT